MLETRFYNNICNTCHLAFKARSPRRLRCPECSKCEWCFAPLAKGKQSARRFCNISCGNKWAWANRDHNERCEFSVTCRRCGTKFLGRSGSANVCQSCLGCELCGQERNSRYLRFCSLRCANIWKYQNCPDVRNALDIARCDKDRGAKISAGTKGKPKIKSRGPLNHNWKGGSTHYRRTEMGQVEYKIWRETIFKQDVYCCVICHADRGPIQAHHVRRWCDRPELRYDITNGVTLCQPCHDRIRGQEDCFAVRFDLHIFQRIPVILTEQEQSRLVRFEAECTFCKSLFTRPPNMRQQKRYFCNLDCMRQFQMTLPRHNPSFPAFAKFTHSRPL